MIGEIGADEEKPHIKKAAAVSCGGLVLLVLAAHLATRSGLARESVSVVVAPVDNVGGRARLQLDTHKPQRCT